MAIEIVSFPMKNGGSLHSYGTVYQGVKTPFFFILVGSSIAGNAAPSSRVHGSEGLPQVAAQALPRTAQLVLKLCLDRAGEAVKNAGTIVSAFWKVFFAKFLGILRKI